MSIKEKIHRLVETLPEESHEAIEEMHYRLFVLEKIERGLRELDAGNGILHEQMRAEFAKWLAN